MEYLRIIRMRHAISRILYLLFFLVLMGPSAFSIAAELKDQRASSSATKKVSEMAYKPEFSRDAYPLALEIQFNLVDYNFLSIFNAGVSLRKIIPRSFLWGVFKPQNSSVGLIINFQEKKQNQIWFQEVTYTLVIQRLLPASSSRIGLPFVEFGPMLRSFREISTQPSDAQLSATRLRPGMWLASGWQVYFSPRWQFNLRLSFLTAEHFATTGVGFGTQYNW